MLVGKRYTGFWEGGQGTRDKARMSRKGVLNSLSNSTHFNPDNPQIPGSTNDEVEVLLAAHEIYSCLGS